MRLISMISKNPKGINYSKDIVAGVIVALVSIPIAMGYAGIAGLPAIYGLYGSLLPILAFAFLSTSPQFVIGVDAMPAVMVGSILAGLGITAESDEALRLVPVITILVALWFIIFFFLKAGKLVKYISKPVMGGFISGVGVTIILMQIPKLFGGTTGTGEIVSLTKHIAHEADMFNEISMLLSIATIVIILVAKKIIPKVPMTVIMMMAGAALQATIGLDQYGVKLLPSVSAGFPKLMFPDIRLINTEAKTLIIESFSIAAVIMAQTLLATGNYAVKYGDKVDNNKELLAYSAMNVAGAVVGCCPLNGSVSRSGIADSYGARSQIMSVAASFTMLIVLLFGTPLLNYLPVPILTGIVMTALIGIIEFSLLGRLWKTSKREWAIFIMSFAAVLLFGTVNGVMVGCMLSFADVAIQATTPPTAFMGRIPGQGNFYALDRNSLARPLKNVVIYRFSGNLIFANIDKFQNDIELAIREDTKVVVVDARGISSIDITAVDRLVLLSKNLVARGIDFYLTEHSGNLNDQIRILGGASLVEGGYVRRTITLALRESGIDKPYELEEYALLDDKKDEEPDEMLAEFEWAFGMEAEEKLKGLANDTANMIVAAVHDKHEEPDFLITRRLHTSWGKLGRFDENEFWDFLELNLEKLHINKKITSDELTMLEKKIEERRVKGENRLHAINPHALKKLVEHRHKVRENMRLNHPKEYEHMLGLQKQFYENLKNKDPELANTIKVLHENITADDGGSDK